MVLLNDVLENHSFSFQRDNDVDEVIMESETDTSALASPVVSAGEVGNKKAVSRDSYCSFCNCE